MNIVRASFSKIRALFLKFWKRARETPSLSTLVTRLISMNMARSNPKPDKTFKKVSTVFGLKHYEANVNESFCGIKSFWQWNSKCIRGPDFWSMFLQKEFRVFLKTISIMKFPNFVHVSVNVSFEMQF